MKIDFQNINSNDTDTINQISEWYFEEWKIPKENTIATLK